MLYSHLLRSNKKPPGEPLRLPDAPSESAKLKGKGVEVDTDLPFLTNSELRGRSDATMRRFVEASGLANLGASNVLENEDLRFRDSGLVDEKVRSLSLRYAESELSSRFPSSIPELSKQYLDLGYVGAGIFSVCGQNHIGKAILCGFADNKLEEVLSNLRRDHARSLKQDYAFAFRGVSGTQPVLVGVLSDGAGEARHSELGAEWLATQAAEAVLRKVATSPRLLSPQFLGGVAADLVMEVYRNLAGRNEEQHDALSDFCSATLELWVQTPREAIRFHLSDGYGAIRGRLVENVSDHRDSPMIGYLPFFGFGLNERDDHSYPFVGHKPPKDSEEAELMEKITRCYRKSLSFVVREYISSFQMIVGQEYGFASDGISSWQTSLLPTRKYTDFPGDKFFRHYDAQRVDEAVFLWNLATYGPATKDPSTSASKFRPFGLIPPIAYLLFSEMQDFSGAVSEALRFAGLPIPLPPTRKHIVKGEAIDGLRKLQDFYSGVDVSSSDRDRQRLYLSMGRLQGLALNTLARTFPAVAWPLSGLGVSDDCSMVSIRRVS